MPSEADILASIYYDTMDIYRKQKTQNATTGITELTEIKVAENIKCALDKGTEANTTGEIGTLSGSYKLFCRPTVDIKIGDRLIITYSGITREFEAGEPFPYISHLEIPLTRKERV